MSTTIKFKNLFGKNITEQQAQLSSEFFIKEFYEDATLRKIESHSKNKSIPWLSYYVYPGEDFSAALLSVQQDYGGGSFFYNRQEFGIYTAWDYEVYDGMQKVGKSIYVLDDSNREIAEQKLDPITLEILKTTKKFYVEDIGEFSDFEPVENNGTLEFEYDTSVTPTEVWVQINLPGYEVYPTIISSGENILLTPRLNSIFNWANHVYYHDASPLIPT